MASRKILFVIDSLGAGGAERSLVESLPLFEKSGIEPIIVCFYKREEGFARSIVEQGFDLRYVLTPSWVQRIRRLRELICHEKPEVLHSTLFNANVAGRLAAWRKPVHVLNSLVNTPYVPLRRLDLGISPSKLEAVRLIDSWTARYCDHFHAVTYTVKQHAIQTMRIAPERITVVERGRDPSRLGIPSVERRQKARSKLGLPEDAEILLNLGRLEYQKGQKYLLQAIAEIRERHSKLIVLIAGRQGSASPELAQLQQELGLNETVQFLGFREDVPDLLAAADIFVFPSLFEGIGGALIEAMALALPIIASDLPELREVVEAGNNAMLVAPASPKEIANAIESLLGDRQRLAHYGQRSREIFEARFTLERSAARMVELYQSVAETVH